MAQSKSLDKDIKTRQDQLGRVREENEILEEEVAQAKKIRKRLQQEESASSAGSGREEVHSGMPKTLDYVAQKAELYELNHAVSNWQKKVELMEIQARKVARAQRKEVESKKSHPSHNTHNRAKTKHQNVH